MPLRCLIVDDSARFLAAARVLLERGGITVVDVASTGAEALERADECRPDVILIDVDLGDESGFDLARRLDERARVAPSDVRAPRIVLISTHAEEDFEELIAASPVAGFLAKSDLSARAIWRLLCDRTSRNDNACSSGPRGR